MYIIDINKLKIGDILLTKDKNPVSKVIRAFTWSGYSHAMIYVGNYSFIHSLTDGGVKAQNIEREFFKRKS